MSGKANKDTATLPKRFYKEVSVSAAGDRAGGAQWQLLLDDKPVKTPGKLPLAVPARELAEALAEEWAAQGERIDPATMPMTRIVNSVLDGVSGREADVGADIIAFAGSDLVCYRAEAPDELVAMQAQAWDPIVEWARNSLGARFVLAQGVMPVKQPPEAIAAFADQVRDLSALELGALHVVTTLTGSALLALAVGRGEMSARDAWAAAHVDEDFQIARWGEDEEAAERRQKRWAEFDAARRVWELANKA